MASLTIKTIAGKRYYYARECKRIDGKPKVVWQKYLGKADDIIAAMTGPAPGLSTASEALVAEFGASAALWRLAMRIGLVEIVDGVCGKRHQGLSVGQYFLLAAINRCVCPKSKAAFSEWYSGTVLRRLVPAPPGALTSQRFWDHMARVDEKAIQDIERSLTARVVAEFGITLDHVLYDATNFFTFIDSFNDAPSLPQRGHSKEGRASLRLIGLALLVTRDFHVPLVHATYPGNRSDAKQFESLCATLIERVLALAKADVDVTIVFDKGQVSHDNIERLGPMHFVSSLPASMVKDLIAVEHDNPCFIPATHEALAGVRTWRVRRKVFGVERTVVVTINPKLRDAQRESLRRAMDKALVKLGLLAAKLKATDGKPHRGRAPTVAGTGKAVAAILKGQHLRALIATQVSEDGGRPQLAFNIVPGALDHLASTRLGKTVLFTSRDDWPDIEIVLGYRGQHHVENAFRTMKDPAHVSFAPLHHWTDQKIRVHVLYCVIALTLASLLEREAAKAGIKGTIGSLLEDLAQIREVMTIYPPPGARRRATRTTTTLSRCNARQRALVDALGLESLLGHTG
jgi:transposase